MPPPNPPPEEGRASTEPLLDRTPSPFRGKGRDGGTCRRDALDPARCHQPQSTMPTKKPGSLFRLTASVSRTQFVGISIAVFALLLAAWWIATAAEWVKPLFLPSPPQVLARLIELAQTGKLWDDASISIWRITVGFLISTAFA